MGIQETIVVAIAIGCIGWLVWRAIQAVFNIRDAENPCAHCATGCALRDEMRKKQEACKEKQGKMKKNCCG